MKFAQILTIAAAAALFSAPAMADEHGHGGFNFDASFHVEGGGAKSEGGAAGGAAAHGDEVDVKNHSDFKSYSGEYSSTKTDCESCGESSSTHEYYTGAEANNNIHAETDGRHDHAEVNSSTYVEGGSAIGNLSGGVSVSGHGGHH